ncbi:MAG: hypothetical protein ROZ64_08535 [Burkholderiaceae bacterium]|jgi:hypothetical protein|nr:hypothetical protein [Burkholderiaceae bacterium]
MDDSAEIDIAFDFRSDTPPGRDPDAQSPMLRRCHRLLWSKPLPSGAVFTLLETTPGVYLHHKSHLGEFWLASDAVVPSFRKEARLSRVFEQISKELSTFLAIGYTIGGMMVFPGNRVEGKMTINGARGFHPRIKDRFDLTLECIRRHYRNQDSPLRSTLARYTGYFQLFGDFKGYTQFFLLQDLVTDDYSAVRFFAPFNDFNSSPIPESMAGYLAYRELAIRFIEARNKRIHTWCTNQRLANNSMPRAALSASADAER